ncbi:putative maltase D [Ooceraea biroi]|uniref:alpha-glucosidase n=1 Tax=Ooceraea biroi TaxID=2015173 RepID=A0A026WEF3_OOCBI|nr:putative maltase D [Ooceraea biroi]
MVDFGYDMSDFVNVDPIFGSLQDFQTLLKRAKKLGLKVVLDLVPNHTSDKHVWFQKALQGNKKYKNYYVWADGKNKDAQTPPNNWISVFSDSAWTYVESQKQWYLHQFDYRQPELNFYNPDVQEEMKNVLKFWLDLGIDGFRVDSAPFIYEDAKLRDEPRSFSTANSTWLPVNQNYKQLNLANEKVADESHYKIYKTLTHMHRTEPALTEGSYRSFTTNDNTVFGVIRNSGSRFVLLLINFNDDQSQVVDLSAEGLSARMTVKVSSLESHVKAGTMVDVCEIPLPAKAAVVYASASP